MSESKGRVLLYSGGMDSYAMRRLWNPDKLLYVDLRTSYSRQEICMLPKDVEIRPLHGLEFFERPESLIVPARNLFLVAFAAQLGDIIALGATAGDRVLDKSERFAKDTGILLSYLWQDWWADQSKQVQVELPLKHMTKRQIVANWIESGGDPMELADRSFSCYTPGGISGLEPCGACKPCYRKWVAFKLNGFNIKPSAEPYIRREILPKILDGTYERHQEIREIKEALGV